MFVRKTPGRLLLLARRAAALVSACVRVIGESQDSGASTGGDFFGYACVRIGNVMPFSSGV